MKKLFLSLIVMMAQCTYAGDEKNIVNCYISYGGQGTIAVIPMKKVLEKYDTFEQGLAFDIVSTDEGTRLVQNQTTGVYYRKPYLSVSIRRVGSTLSVVMYDRSNFSEPRLILSFEQWNLVAVDSLRVEGANQSVFRCVP